MGTQAEFPALGDDSPTCALSRRQPHPTVLLLLLLRYPHSHSLSLYRELLGFLNMLQMLSKVTWIP